MTAKVTVANADNTGVIDLTNISPNKGTPFFDGDTSLIELGMRCANGEASQGTFKIMDPLAQLPVSTFNIPPHKLLTWSEDSSGDEIWLARGRIATYDGGREENAEIDKLIGFDVTVDDGNIELRGQAFTEPWVRPAENGLSRVVALGSYTLAGEDSTAPHSRATCDVTVSTSHLVLNTLPTMMPAKTYPPGTQPQDVLQDCADTENKIFSVVIHHAGGSHLCLLYIANDDHTTYASPIKISDELDEWDPTDLTAPVFEPHWEMGKASLYDGQQMITGIVSEWNGQFIFAEHAPTIVTNDYWVESYSDANSVSLAQAQQVVNALINQRRLMRITHRVSIIMLPEQLPLIAAGMSLEIKSPAVAGGTSLGTYITRRVVECKFEPRIDGRYWAHLHLNHALRRYPDFKGGIKVPRPADDPTGSAVPNGNWVDGNSGILPGDISLPIVVGTEANRYLLAFTFSSEDAGTIDINSVTWGAQSLTLLDQIDGSGIGKIAAWGLIAPNSGSGNVVLDKAGTPDYMLSVHYLHGVNQATPIRDLVTEANTIGANPTSVTLTTVAGDFCIDGRGERNNYRTVGSGQTLIHQDVAGDNRIQASSEVASGTSTVLDWSNAEGVQIGIAFVGTGGSGTQPIGGDGDGTVGDNDGTYVGPNHVHEHDFPTGSDMHEAADITIADAGSFFTATDVEGALQELGTGGGGASLTIEEEDASPTGVFDTLKVPNDSLTDNGDGSASLEYLLPRHGGREVVEVISSSGSSATLNLANANDFDVTLTSDCTITLSGALADSGCSMFVKLRQGSGGPYAVTWPGSVVWPGGVAPILSVDTGEYDIVSFHTTDGGTTWDGAYPSAGGSGPGEHDHDGTYAFVGHTHSESGGGLPMTTVIGGELFLVVDENFSLIADI